MNKKIKLIIKVLLILVIMIMINSISNSVKADAIYEYIITKKDNGKIEVERQPYRYPEEFDGIENEFLYNIIDKKNKYIRIEGYLLKKQTENIIFPSEINGYKVKEISNNVLRDYWTDHDYLSSIKKITIGEGVEILGVGDYDMEERYGSFSRLANLKEVILPSTLKEIRDWTFSGCTSLEEIKLPNRLEYIGPEAFCETNLKKIKIGKNVSCIEEGVFSRCDNLNSIKVDSENKKYYSKGGVLYNKNKTKLIKWPSTKATKSYKIPSTVKKIEYAAFYNAKYLEKILIPNKVLEIDASTFALCKKLKSVTLPKNLNSIGYRAFYKCTNLKNISLPKNPNPSMHIGVKVFEGCKNLKSIKLPKTLIMYRYSPYYNIFKDCKSLTKLELPEGVEKFSINNIAGCKKLKKLIFKNPYCKIINTTEIKWNYGQVIYGYDNSTAEKFAKKNGLKFKSLGKCTTVMNLDINGTNKKNKIQLTWKKVKGAKYYQIYQSADGKKWKRISSQKGTKYTVKNLKKGKTYYFKVRAAKNRNKKYSFGVIKDITM